MKTLRDVLVESEKSRTAVGHFNISDLVALKAVAEAARGLNVPAIVGVSEGEREFVGVRQAAALVRSIREEFDFPIFLNADHTHSLAKAVEAAKAGFDSVVFDRSTLPFAENVSETKKAVEALKAINPSIIVEGEIGDIGSGSEIHDSTPESSRILTKPDEGQTICRQHRHRRAGALLYRATCTDCCAAWYAEKCTSAWILAGFRRSRPPPEFS